MSVLIMDDVLHKLHCLNYEADYCLPKDITPFHKLYFAVPAAHSGCVLGAAVRLRARPGLIGTNAASKQQ